MALNISTIPKNFKRSARINIADDKSTTFKVINITCTFKRQTKEEAQLTEDRLNEVNTSSEREAIIKSKLEEVWLSWDVVDNNGPLEFNEANREFLYNELPPVLTEVYLTWMRGILGADRKNA